MEPIRLVLSEPRGRACHRAPLTRGVPLPSGVASSPDELGLYDGTGTRLPVQLRPLARHRDGSLEWVLLDFAADLEGGGRAEYLLAPATGDEPAADAAITVTDDEDGVRVHTGRLSFTVPRREVGVLDEVQLDGQRLTGAAGDAWARIVEGDSLSPTQRRVFGLGGDCRASLAPDAWEVAVEEAGPLRTVVTCRGALELFAPMHHYAGYRPLHFVLRMHAYAGQPYLRLLHTVVMTLDPRQTEVEELGLSLPLATAGAGVRCRTAAQPECELEIDSGGGLVLAQREDNHYQLLEQKGPRRVLVEGERTEGWVTLEGDHGGLGVALRHMAEEYPKALRLRAGSGGIDALLWSHPEGRRLPLSRYSDEVAWHEGEGVYADGTGTAKTSELFVTYFGRGDSAAAIDDLRQLLSPVHVAVDSAHLGRCQVTGGFAPADNTFPHSDRLLAGFIDWLRRQIELGRWYGFLDWGDALVAWEEASQDWRFQGRWGWCNSEWDPRHAVWIQYARTGDPALFELAEAMTRHSTDVDTCHWHPVRPYFVGGCYRHSVDHFGDEPTASHTFLDNWIDHYYLTGDLRTLEVLHEAGDFLHRYRWTEDPRFSFSLRSIANALRGLLYLFEATGEARHLRRAEEVYDVIARGQNEDGSWHKRFQVSTADHLPLQAPYGMATEGTTLAVELGSAAPFTDEEHLALRGRDQPIVRVLPLAEQKGYQTHYLMIGLELFHQLTGREDVAHVYLRAVDWFCGGPGPLRAATAVQQQYGGILCRHLAYAWRLSGDATYLDIARQVLAHLLTMQDSSDDPRRRGSVGMSPMYLSLVFFGVPYLLQALRDAGVGEPQPG